MAGKIEDYAIIGDTSTVALVDRSGSIDWWCAPRIDSSACFAALLGDEKNGRWIIAPRAPIAKVGRRYESETLVLETLFDTPEGSVAVLDFMLPGHPQPTIHRVVEGRSGTVTLDMELTVRFDYGSIAPWVRPVGTGLVMVAGPDGLRLHSPVPLEDREGTAVASFAVRAGQREAFSLTWFRSDTERPAAPREPGGSRPYARMVAGMGRTLHLRGRLAGRRDPLAHHPQSPHVCPNRRRVRRRHHVAPRGDRRHPQLGLPVLLAQGCHAHPAGVGDVWATSKRRLPGLTGCGAPSPAGGGFQIMYNVEGGRRLTELELTWLAGYEGSAPVRIGNEASTQFQLDVYGEVMDAVRTAASAGLPAQPGYGPQMALGLMGRLEQVWNQPDDGIWEVRGGRQHFTHSKVDGLGRVRSCRPFRREDRRRPISGHALDATAGRGPHSDLRPGLESGDRQLQPVLRLFQLRREPPHARPAGLPPPR